MKNERLTIVDSQDIPSRYKAWMIAVRPQTWIACLSPVGIGLLFAQKDGFFDWGSCSALLLFALSLQIAANLVNDLFDALQGADSHERLGPPRALQMGWLNEQHLRYGILIAFGIALCPGLYLIHRVGLWALPIVVGAVLAAWFYTAGKKSLSYIGLGDLAAFLFFGPIALCGSYYAVTLQWNMALLLAGSSSGCLAVALLTANNLRDQAVDAAAHKKTLVVRLGATFGCWEYALCLLFAAILPAFLGFYRTLYLIPAANYLIRQTRHREGLLSKTALFLWAYTLFVTVDIIYST